MANILRVDNIGNDILCITHEDGTVSFQLGGTVENPTAQIDQIIERDGIALFSPLAGTFDDHNQKLTEMFINHSLFSLP